MESRLRIGPSSRSREGRWPEEPLSPPRTRTGLFFLAPARAQACSVPCTRGARSGPGRAGGTADPAAAAPCSQRDPAEEGFEHDPSPLQLMERNVSSLELKQKNEKGGDSQGEPGAELIESNLDFDRRGLVVPTIAPRP